MLGFVDELEIANNVYRTEKYIVTAVYMREGVICIRLIQDVLRPNDTQAAWVQDYRAETGEDISFF